jgi:ribosomal protein S27AE
VNISMVKRSGTMYKNGNPKKIKPPVSALDEQMIKHQVKRAAAAKPKCIDSDKEDYFRSRYYCPDCGTFLATYHYGRAWTSNGLAEELRIDCPVCGKMIDWSGGPYPKKEG